MGKPFWWHTLKHLAVFFLSLGLVEELKIPTEATRDCFEGVGSSVH
jgi:hypothetical protein